MSKDCDPVVQQAIQDKLDKAYVEDGRDNPEHPLHSLYTGLSETEAFKR